MTINKSSDTVSQEWANLFNQTISLTQNQISKTKSTKPDLTESSADVQNGITLINVPYSSNRNGMKKQYRIKPIES